MIQPTSSIWKSLTVLVLSLAAVVVALSLSHSPGLGCFDCDPVYDFSSGMQGDMTATGPLNPWDLATLAFVGVLIVRPLIGKRNSLRSDDVSDEA